jgi:hypothetical protein
MSSLLPPISPAAEVDALLRSQGYAVLDARGIAGALPASAEALEQFSPFWSDLPPDTYLRDGGHYRRRRHSCFVARPDGSIEQVPHRAHWQPVAYNALHGGLTRWFEPIAPAMIALPAHRALLQSLAAHATALKGAQPWFIEVHPFRIDTTDGIGRPTPEGAHRDDLVAVILIDRQNIKGGETRVFEAEGPHGIRFTMIEPWTTLLLDDARVIHESTPIQPLLSDGGAIGCRDTLVITLRARGFQGASP